MEGGGQRAAQGSDPHHLRRLARERRSLRWARRRRSRRHRHRHRVSHRQRPVQGSKVSVLAGPYRVEFKISILLIRIEIMNTLFYYSLRLRSIRRIKTISSIIMIIVCNVNLLYCPYTSNDKTIFLQQRIECFVNRSFVI